MSVKILQGDCRQVLKTLPDESVHCVVTSPPYWGLRDYGVDGQMGLEPTLGEHIEVMVDVFRHVWRVLRKDGTLWLNYGDSYCPVGGSHDGRTDNQTGVGEGKRVWRNGSGRADGIVDSRGQRNRNGITEKTLKPKDLCMVPNRLAIALQEAGWWVRSEIIWAKPNPMPESVTDRPATAHEKVFLLSKSARYFYDHEAVRQPMKESSVSRLSQDVDKQEGSTRAHAGGKTNGNMKAAGARWTNEAKYQNRTLANKADKQRGHGRRHDGFNDRWDQMAKEEQQANGANLKNVWHIATKPFSEAHFATFPPELAERCIKAGCPEGGTVLDPFGGAGTTGLVADRLGRNAILIELNQDYIDIAERRIHNDAPLFADVTTTGKPA